MSTSLRNRLTTLFIILAILPLLLVGLILANSIISVQMEQAGDSQDKVAQRVADEILFFIQARENELRFLTEIENIQELEREQQTRLLSNLLAQQDIYDDLTLVNPQGQSEISVSRLAVVLPDQSISYAETDKYEIPKATGNTYFSSIFFSAETDEPLMTIAVPLSDLQTKQFAGVIIANFRFKSIWDLVAQISFEGSGTLYVADAEKRVVAHQNPSIVRKGTLAELRLVGEPRWVGLEGVDIILGTAAIQLGTEEFTVYSELPLFEALASAINLFFIFVGVIVVAGLIAIVVGPVIAQQITGPIESMAKIAQIVGEGDLDQQMPLAGDEEILTLAETFNTMITQLRELVGSLEQRITDRTRALETSTEVSRRLSTILDQRDLVREVVEQIQSAFDYYHAHIYLFDEAKENLLMVGGTGEAGRKMLEQGHRVPKGSGLVGQAGDTNLPVLVPDVSQAEGWLPNPLLPDTQAEVAIPIAIGENVLGVLDVQDDTIGGVTEADAELLQSIANQVAIALQNARAYQRTQQQIAREALLANINQQIQSTAEVEEALQVAVREVGRALGTDIRVKLESKSNGKQQANE